MHPWTRVTFEFWELLKNALEVTLVPKNIFFLKILNLVQSFVECKVSLADGRYERRNSWRYKRQTWCLCDLCKPWMNIINWRSSSTKINQWTQVSNECNKERVRGYCGPSQKKPLASISSLLTKSLLVPSGTRRRYPKSPQKCTLAHRLIPAIEQQQWLSRNRPSYIEYRVGIKKWLVFWKAANP